MEAERTVFYIVLTTMRAKIVVVFYIALTTTERCHQTTHCSAWCLGQQVQVPCSSCTRYFELLQVCILGRSGFGTHVRPDKVNLGVPKFDFTFCINTASTNTGRLLYLILDIAFIMDNCYRGS